MDGGPVAGAKRRRSTWKLNPGIAPLAQGLIVNGFSHLPTGRALFLGLGPEVRGGGWITALERVSPVTVAVPPAPGERPTQAAALALTWTALSKMGLPETALASFSRPFYEGMFQADRLRRLGDRRRNKWLDTVIPDGPIWSANTPLRPVVGAVGPYDVARGTPEERVTTPVSVDALLLIYTLDEQSARSLADTVAAVVQPYGVSVVRQLELVLDVEGVGISREHFGFADGLSQPEPFDQDGAVTLDGADVRTGRPVQGVPLGEFVIGYRNGHHEKAPGPVTPGPTPDGPDPSAVGLVPHPEAQGFYDLGLNGSYMVVRELRQDVVAFWRSMEASAAKMRADDPTHSSHITADWLAERVVGRDREGHLLCPGGGRLPPDEQDMPDSSFLFRKTDPRGLGCAPGSHVRRANPRDSLAPTEADGPSLLAAANNHRILRRGRKFGPKLTAPTQDDDGVERGLLFVCLNTDIARQFEFVQQTWLLNSDFATLFEEVDPLMGPDGRMTIREEGLRRSIEVATFVQMAGGDYFFLPSLPALRYLALL